MEKLKPTTTGELKISVHYPSGQLSTYKVASTMTIGEFKSKLGATSILDGLEETPKAHTLDLMYMGAVLDDADTFESKLVADRSVLTQLPMKRESPEQIAKFVEKAIADVKALHTVQFPTHTANLYERIKHNPARGLDLDYDIPSWHYDYRPYNQYVPPVDGEAQIQAPDYERDGDQAWRRDYYINGPGNQAEVNNEYAILNAPEETE